jgi:hypothetical protein
MREREREREACRVTYYFIEAYAYLGVFEVEKVPLRYC